MVFLKLLCFFALHGCTKDYQFDNESTSSLDSSGSGNEYDPFQSGGCPHLHKKYTPAPYPTCNNGPKVCTKSRYRTFDGTCNNLKRTNWGAAMTPYVRMTKNNYADGVHEMPISVTGKELPNARELSYRIFRNKYVVSSFYNLNSGQWGQIITHDMSLTAGVPQTTIPQKCCNLKGQLTDEANNTKTCAPILIPKNDPVYSFEGRQCIAFVRTKTTLDSGCTIASEPAQQLTAVSGFMDLSIVYGDSKSQADSLRTKKGGKMISEVRKGQEWPPRDPDAAVVCDATSSTEPCYLGGDVRINQNTQLTALQVILLRNHNRIANKLAKLNPHWNDEKLFQEARRIHIAEIQHINYYEYLPNLLGLENMVKRKLIYPNAKSYVNDYDPEVNPAIINEHATAALRYFHTLLLGFLKRISESRELAGVVRLSIWMNKPSILEVNNTFDELTRGLTFQQMGLDDQYLTAEITKYLFKGNRTLGDDLRAIDIHRARDHGLGTYIEARAVCDLPVPKTFREMRDFISDKNVNLLQSLYASVQDVDLMVAGSLERDVPGSLVGPTFFCILMKQFYNTRVGDRYFYENGQDPSIAFTPAQLGSIRKGANMARMLCDNTKTIRKMQRKAFWLVSKENPIIPCDKLPFIDLSHWQEEKDNEKY